MNTQQQQRDALTWTGERGYFISLCRCVCAPIARVVELVDTQVSEACAFTGVGVQVPPRALEVKMRIRRASDGSSFWFSRMSLT